MTCWHRSTSASDEDAAMDAVLAQIDHQKRENFLFFACLGGVQTVPQSKQRRKSRGKSRRRLTCAWGGGGVPRVAGEKWQAASMHCCQ